MSCLTKTVFTGVKKDLSLVKRDFATTKKAFTC